MKYIGLDAHISSCSFHVLDGHGKSLDWREMPTNGAMLIKYLKEIEGEKTLCFEETGLSRWLYGLLHREVDKLIVCDPVKNRYLSQGPKKDPIDAKKLAELLRGNFLHPVYHGIDAREELRDLVYGYLALIQDFVRLKNRYKAIFRSQGINQKGAAVYGDESFLKDIKKGHARFVGQRVYDIIRVFEEKRKEYVKELAKQQRKFPEIRLLKTIPGIGVIQACKIAAIVVTPDRFENKYKFYSYCGLVKHDKESGGQSYGKRCAHSNRTLKGVFRTAGQTVLRGQSGLRKHYDRLMSKGCHADDAYNSVCRKVASLSLAVWKTGEKYRDDFINTQKLIRP